ncbi:MAG: hypothetical protein L3J05_09255, partial [Robiginitomaculum sp.]|nr:hypothetical protein [Robiginitomaculum sp.]
ALTKHFGDWKRKFPNGFGGVQQKQSHKLAVKPAPRTYNWKPFTLVKIFNVERFLFGHRKPSPDSIELQAAYLKLWGVDIQDKTKSGAPRSKRAMKPVSFTPDELAPEAATGVSQGAEKPPKKIPEKLGIATIYPSPEYEFEETENFDNNFIREPP